MISTHEQYQAALDNLFVELAIPNEIQSGIESLAWEEGHSYGFEEVLGHVRSFWDTLKESYEKYGAVRYAKGYHDCQMRYAGTD